MRPESLQDTYPTWILVIALTLLLVAVYGVTDRIDRAGSIPEADVQAERIAAAVGAIAQRLSTARALTSGFEKCPAAEPGMTDVVTLVIRSAADAQPEVLTCIRYAERSFAPRNTVRRSRPKTVMAEGEK